MQSRPIEPGALVMLLPYKSCNPDAVARLTGRTAIVVFKASAPEEPWPVWALDAPLPEEARLAGGVWLGWPEPYLLRIDPPPDMEREPQEEVCNEH